MIKENINKCFQPKIIVAILYIKNLKLISTVQGFSPYKSFYTKLLELNLLLILRSTIYIYIYKDEQELKSEKFILKILTDQLINFDGYTIYQRYFKEKKNIIRVKNLYIFKDIKIKVSIILLNYKNSKLSFQDLLLNNNDNNKVFMIILCKPLIIALSNIMLKPTS